MELSIDTSTRYASVAISEEGQLMHYHTWKSQRNHSVELVPSIIKLLESHHLTVEDLDAIFVAKGPGAFSALRVGMSTSKTLSFGLNIPIVGIPTTEIEIHPFIHNHEEIIALIPAGRNRVYAAQYSSSILSSPIVVLSLEDFIENIQDHAFYCGEGVSQILEQKEIIVKFKHSEIEIPSRKPEILCRLGYEKVKMNEVDDLALLEPMYITSTQINSANNKNL